MIGKIATPCLLLLLLLLPAAAAAQTATPAHTPTPVGWTGGGEATATPEEYIPYIPVDVVATCAPYWTPEPGGNFVTPDFSTPTPGGLPATWTPSFPVPTGEPLPGTPTPIPTPEGPIAPPFPLVVLTGEGGYYPEPDGWSIDNAEWFQGGLSERDMGSSDPLDFCDWWGVWATSVFLHKDDNPFRMNIGTHSRCGTWEAGRGRECNARSGQGNAIWSLTNQAVSNVMPADSMWFTNTLQVVSAVRFTYVRGVIPSAPAASLAGKSVGFRASCNSKTYHSSIIYLDDAGGEHTAFIDYGEDDPCPYHGQLSSNSTTVSLDHYHNGSGDNVNLVIEEFAIITENELPPPPLDGPWCVDGAENWPVPSAVNSRLHSVDFEVSEPGMGVYFEYAVNDENGSVQVGGEWLIPGEGKTNTVLTHTIPLSGVVLLNFELMAAAVGNIQMVEVLSDTEPIPLPTPVITSTPVISGTATPDLPPMPDICGPDGDGVGGGGEVDIPVHTPWQPPTIVPGACYRIMARITIPGAGGTPTEGVVIPNIDLCVDYLDVGVLNILGIEIDPRILYSLLAIGLLYSLFFRG